MLFQLSVVVIALWSLAMLASVAAGRFNLHPVGHRGRRISINLIKRQ
jgi:hypothetical protein